MHRIALDAIKRTDKRTNTRPHLVQMSGTRESTSRRGVARAHKLRQIINAKAAALAAAHNCPFD